MKILSSWLISVFAVSMIISIAESMMPEGRVKVFGRFTCGLILMFAVLYPLISAGRPDLSFIGSGYSQRIEDRRKALEADGADSLKALIESRAEAYISDKASSLSLACRVSVEAEVGGDGIPRPYSAKLSIPENRALSDYISNDVGISPERQTWNAEVADESG
jgi:hypothetical protein